MNNNEAEGGQSHTKEGLYGISKRDHPLFCSGLWVDIHFHTIHIYCCLQQYYLKKTTQIHSARMTCAHVILSSPSMNSAMLPGRSRAVLGAPVEASRVVGGTGEDAAMPITNHINIGASKQDHRWGPLRGTSKEEAACRWRHQWGSK